MQLSNSSLGIFSDCPRCFFFDKKLGIPRPRSIFSSLPNGIDGLLKKSFDSLRGTLPEFLNREELKGFVLFENVKKYQNWKSNPLKYKDENGNVLIGAFDDILFRPEDQVYAMLDFKTKGSAPDQAYCEKYYQKQVDLYTLLLQSGGLKTAAFGVLYYFYPATSDTVGLIKFEQKTFLLEANADRGKVLFDAAIKVLSLDTPPPFSGCEYCLFAESHIGKANPV